MQDTTACHFWLFFLSPISCPNYATSTSATSVWHLCLWKLKIRSRLSDGTNVFFPSHTSQYPTFDPASHAVFHKTNSIIFVLAKYKFKFASTNARSHTCVGPPHVFVIDCDCRAIFPPCLPSFSQLAAWTCKLLARFPPRNHPPSKDDLQTQFQNSISILVACGVARRRQQQIRHRLRAESSPTWRCSGCRLKTSEAGNRF